jgi:integrase
LRTYRQIARELKARWEDWRTVDERAEVKDSGDLEVYSVEEVWALARHATSLTDAAIFLLASLCGMRRSEILGLRWRTVLFEQRRSFCVVASLTPAAIGCQRISGSTRCLWHARSPTC